MSEPMTPLTDLPRCPTCGSDKRDDRYELQRVEAHVIYCADKWHEQPPLTDLLAAHREKAEEARAKAERDGWLLVGTLDAAAMSPSVRQSAVAAWRSIAAHIERLEAENAALLAVAEAANALTRWPDGAVDDDGDDLFAALDNLQEVMSR